MPVRKGKGDRGVFEFGPSDNLPHHQVGFWTLGELREKVRASEKARASEQAPAKK